MVLFNIIPTSTMMCFFRRHRAPCEQEQELPAAAPVANNNTNLAGDGPYPRPALNPTTAKKAHHDRDLRGHPDPLRSCPVENRSPASPANIAAKEKEEDKKGEDGEMEGEEGEERGGANAAGSVSQI